jgi:hypothetical protein
MPATSVDSSTSTSGPMATELSSTISSVRRSRSASRSSLRKTIQAAPIMRLRPIRPAPALRSVKASCTKVSSKSVCPVQRAQFGHRALGHGAAVRDHHHLVAQPLHLLHDVGGEDDALALLVAQAAQVPRAARAWPARPGRWSARPG